jgi:hypothetical protein
MTPMKKFLMKLSLMMQLIIEPDYEIDHALRSKRKQNQMIRLRVVVNV